MDGLLNPGVFFQGGLFSSQSRNLGARKTGEFFSGSESRLLLSLLLSVFLSLASEFLPRLRNTWLGHPRLYTSTSNS